MTAARIAIVFGAMCAIAAGPVGPRYGDTLVSSLMAQNRAIKGLRIAATNKTGTLVVVTAGDATSGDSMTLRNAMGTAIGTVSVAGRVDREAVATYLFRRIYLANNLGEADPFVPGSARSRRGQALVEAMLTRFPDLVTLALHVALPGQPNRIIASNFGRIGKPGDKDDAHVIADGAVLREVTDGATRMAVELPLLDQGGLTIGALSTSFTVPAGTDPQQRYARALKIRDELRRLIPSIRSLT